MDSMDVSNILPYGIQYSEILFPIGVRAIVEWQDRYYLVLPEESNFNDEYKLLTELFSYLRYMENEHIVYVQSITSKVSVLLNGVSDQKKNTVREEYDLGNNCALCLNNNLPSIHCVARGVQMTNVNDVTSLRSDIEHYLQSYIYPTTSLSYFIKHDYLSESDYQTKRSVSISRVSIVVAIIIALCSPIVTLLISNKWGYVTINDNQFEIIKALKPVSSQDSCDEIAIDLPDSVFLFPFPWQTILN